MTSRSRIETLQGYAKDRSRVTLTWDVERTPDTTFVTFKGEIDENADLRALVMQLKHKAVLDLGEVRRINSAGVREWVNFMRKLGHLEQVALVRCTSAIVNQLNMIYNFRGRATVVTFFAPYICEPCATEVDVLLDTRMHFRDNAALRPPDIKCPQCGGMLTFDDIPERYFSFIVQS